MPHVQSSSLMESIERSVLQYRIIVHSNVIDAAIEEIGVVVNMYNVPSK